MKYVVFDGDCGICSAFAQFVEKHKTAGTIKTIPSYDFDLKQYGINEKLALLTVIFIDSQSKQIYYRTRAVMEIYKHINGPLKLIGYILSNPAASFLLDPVYNLIARNRTWLSAKLGLNSCKVR